MAKNVRQKPDDGPKTHEETLGGAAKSLLEAVAFMVILVLLVLAAVFITSYVSNNRAETEETVAQEEPTATLPWDVPAYAGAVQTRFTHSGKKAIYEYDLPQGSVNSVQAFYKEQLETHEWVRQPRSSQYVSEYVDPQGERTLTITLTYRSGKVHMKLQIVRKNGD